MSERQIDETHFSKDIQEFIRLLHEHGVQFVVIGGEAVIFHGYPRYTGDVDFNQAWDGRVPATLSGIELNFLGVEELVAAKEAAGRPKDLEDLRYLKRLLDS